MRLSDAGDIICDSNIKINILWTKSFGFSITSLTEYQHLKLILSHKIIKKKLNLIFIPILTLYALTVPSIISPNNITVISNVQVKRMKEMMANDVLSFKQILSNRTIRNMENSEENIQVDFRV